MTTPARTLSAVLRALVEAHGEAEVRAALAEVTVRPKTARRGRVPRSAREIAERARETARRARGE